MVRYAGQQKVKGSYDGARGTWRIHELIPMKENGAQQVVS